MAWKDTETIPADGEQPRGGAWIEPSAEQAEQVHARVGDLAAALAAQLAQAPPAGTAQDADGWHLARLRALREVRTAAEALADEAAAEAGLRGASYPQLGNAWAITRQGARKKWPQASGSGNRITPDGEGA
ncbi:hypothetical protein [Streptomyces sp. NPDC053560]|uniref:hypothetical protein n=1 Tax=Streptomyces sp. NPDC053560 TaxID=3365711 RepID=UPI0037D85B69